MSILGKTTRGKAVRAGLLAFCLYLDLESPGYLKLKSPLEPFVSYLPVQNFLNCPSREVMTLPVIPGLSSLESKSLTERDLRQKFGNPICIKNGLSYFKVEAFGKQYFIAAKINEIGKLEGYKVYQK